MTRFNNVFRVIVQKSGVCFLVNCERTLDTPETFSLQGRSHMFFLTHSYKGHQRPLTGGGGGGVCGYNQRAGLCGATGTYMGGVHASYDGSSNQC